MNCPNPNDFLPPIPAPHPKHIERFKELYRDRFEAELSTEEALFKLISLLFIVQYQQQANAAYLHQLRTAQQRRELAKTGPVD